MIPVTSYFPCHNLPNARDVSRILGRVRKTVLISLLFSQLDLLILTLVLSNFKKLTLFLRRSNQYCDCPTGRGRTEARSLITSRAVGKRNSLHLLTKRAEVLLTTLHRSRTI